MPQTSEEILRWLQSSDTNRILIHNIDEFRRVLQWFEECEVELCEWDQAYMRGEKSANSVLAYPYIVIEDGHSSAWALPDSDGEVMDFSEFIMCVDGGTILQTEMSTEQFFDS